MRTSGPIPAAAHRFRLDLCAVLATSMAIAAAQAAGSEGPAYLVKNINRSVDPHGWSNPAGFVSVGALTYFAADDGTDPSALWRTDGTSAGTLIVRDAGGQPALANLGQTAVVGADLFFLDPAGKLWKTDGTPTGTVMVSALAARELAAAGGTLYFAVGPQLWKSDGTPDHAALVAEFPAGGDSYPGQVPH